MGSLLRIVDVATTMNRPGRFAWAFNAPFRVGVLVSRPRSSKGQSTTLIPLTSQHTHPAILENFNPRAARKLSTLVSPAPAPAPSAAVTTSVVCQSHRVTLTDYLLPSFSAGLSDSNVMLQWDMNEMLSILHLQNLKQLSAPFKKQHCNIMLSFYQELVSVSSSCKQNLN